MAQTPRVQEAGRARVRLEAPEAVTVVVLAELAVALAEPVVALAEPVVAWVARAGPADRAGAWVGRVVVQLVDPVEPVDLAEPVVALVGRAVVRLVDQVVAPACAPSRESTTRRSPSPSILARARFATGRSTSSTAA